jgi:long-subunit acyl-CoA synthetase (AMP-forming)
MQIQAFSRTTTGGDRVVLPGVSDQADTFPKLLIRNARLHGDRPAIRHKIFGIWQVWTWRQVLSEARAYAIGLHRGGLGRGDTIAIVGANRPRLYWSMMAAQMLGAVPVPVYADAVADEVAHVLIDAEARFAVAQDQEQVDKIQSIAGRVPRLDKTRSADCATMTTPACVRSMKPSAMATRRSEATPRSGIGSIARSRRVKGPRRRSFSTHRAPPPAPRASC